MAKRRADKCPKFEIDIKTLNDAQDAALNVIHKNRVSFLLGPPGTAKTHLATMYAVQALGAGRFEKIYLCRPAIEAGGERLGYLPGSMEEKAYHYLRPVFNILEEQVDEAMRQRIAAATEIVPLAYLRGWTFRHGVAIMDEAQNGNKALMKLFLTRLGVGSKLIICGDPSQSDIRDGVLSRTAELQSRHSGIAMHRFTNDDIVRDPLVGLMSDTMDEV